MFYKVCIVCNITSGDKQNVEQGGPVQNGSVCNKYNERGRNSCGVLLLYDLVSTRSDLFWTGDQGIP